MLNTIHQQAFSFPIMKPAEIVQALNDYGIRVSVDELSNPEKYKDMFRIVLEQLVEICIGTTREEIYQPAFAGLSSLNYPELHDESIPQLNNFRACSKLMEVCGISDFTIKDLMAPTAKRLRKQLSGIINFAKFRDDVMVMRNELSTSRDDLAKKMNSMKDSNESLNVRLNLLREQTAEESKIINAMEEECKDIQSKINVLNNQQAEIRDESSELKEINSSLKEDINKYTLELEKLTVIKKNFASQVVSSPDRFRKQIVDVGLLLQTEQKDSKTAERRVRELTMWVGIVDEACTDVSKALETIYELENEVKRQKAILVQLDEMKQIVITKRDSLSQLQLSTRTQEKQSKRSEEKLKLLKQQALNRQQESKHSTDELHKQLIEAENCRAQVI
jgi:kinetochore protein Nuf2